MAVASGQRRHKVRLQTAGVPVPDGEGGFTETPADLDPAEVFARISGAAARDLERLTAGTTLATATHVFTMSYHPQVTVKTLITFDGRTFNVIGVGNPEERNIETIAVAVEVVEP